MPAFALVTLLVGIFSGSYPAFFLSAFQPVTVLKGSGGNSAKRHSLLRNSLVVLQFSISIVMIIGTAVVFEQLNFFQHKKLGFDKEQLMSLQIAGGRDSAIMEPLTNKLLANPQILDAALSSNVPGQRGIEYGYRSDPLPDGAEQLISTYSVDERYIGLLDLEIIAGRDFPAEYHAENPLYILNETALAQLGWESPPQAIGGRIFQEGSPDGEVIGVVKDFHFESLHREIKPLVLRFNPNRFGFLSIKLAPGDIPATMAFIESSFRNLLPGRPYDFFFLDEFLNRRYRAEIQMGKVFGNFAFLAILIACMGLFGLASFTTEQRTKEVGIRKIHGASVASILLLLSRQFAKLVGIAFLAASPIAYILMERWLGDFENRVTLGIDTFLLAGALALLIALLSVSYNVVKAALANPATSLRYE